MSKKNFVLWTFLIVAVCVAYGAALDHINFGTQSFIELFGAGIGYGLPIALATGLIALIVHAFQKFRPEKRQNAMCVWTIATLATLVVFGLSDKYVVRLVHNMDLELPIEEFIKLDGNASYGVCDLGAGSWQLNQPGNFCVVLYNGSSWEIRELNILIMGSSTDLSRIYKGKPEEDIEPLTSGIVWFNVGVLPSDWLMVEIAAFGSKR